LQSTERAWFNWGETGLCQPHVTDAWLPRVFFRCALAARAVCVELAGGNAAALPQWPLLGGLCVSRFCSVPCREVYGKQEYDFHVYKELMWGEEAGARPQPLCPASVSIGGC
jgi:hypothetical protein